MQKKNKKNKTPKVNRVSCKSYNSHRHLQKKKKMRLVKAHFFLFSVEVRGHSSLSLDAARRM